MDKKQLAKKISFLIQDPQFVLKLAETKSDEEAVKLFADNDCELAADKVKLVRDTLNSLLKGDVEISEEDLENISGGKLDYTKILAVAFLATMAIGGTAVFFRSGVKTHSASGGSTMGANFASVAAEVGRAATKVAGAAARVATEPTWMQRLKGVFSKNQRIRNTALATAGEVVANFAGTPGRGD